MKRMILSGCLLIGLATASSAQTTKNSSGQSGEQFKKTSAKTKKQTKPTVSNRKEYQWKDGQTATPTGHEATSSNGSAYTALPKDTAAKGKNKKQ